MNRTSLTCAIAAVVAASGAFAQSAPAPAPDSTHQTEPRSGAQAANATPSQTQSPSSKSSSSRTSPTTRSARPGTQRQTQTGEAAKASQSGTETRPDARYPNPSGQDSRPGKTTLAAVGSKKEKEAGQDQNPNATGRSKQVERLAKKNTYTEAAGAKANLSTACSTARQTPNGGVDCGTSGNSATEGKIVTKSN